MEMHSPFKQETPNWKQLFIFTILVNIDQDKLIRIVL